MRTLGTILCALTLFGAWHTSAGAQPGDDPIAKATRKADTIVLGRVVGTVDTKPGAQARKAHEAHWIVVTKTLKDHDLSGQRIKVRPNGVHWNDGATVLLFLAYRGTGFYDAAPTVVDPADVEHAAATIRAIAGAPKPKLALRMRYVSCGCGPTACACTGTARNEFAMQKNGAFVWTSHYAADPARGLPARTERRVGTLEPTVARTLLARITRTKPMPLADCGGTVEFAITGDDGSTRYHTHSLVAPTHASTLVASIDDLVATFGKTSEDRR